MRLKVGVSFEFETDEEASALVTRLIEQATAPEESDPLSSILGQVLAARRAAEASPERSHWNPFDPFGDSSGGDEREQQSSADDESTTRKRTGRKRAPSRAASTTE